MRDRAGLPLCEERAVCLRAWPFASVRRRMLPVSEA